MTQGVPNVTQEQVECTIQMKRVYNKLYRLLNRDEYKKRSAIYYRDNTELCHEQGREWNARNGALKMKGLCHLCYCSNVEIYNHKGQIICNPCLSEQLKK